MKKTAVKRLSLNRETLGLLERRDLGEILGATTDPCSASCDTYSDPTCGSCFTCTCTC